MTPSFKDVAYAWKQEKQRYVKLSSYATYIQILNARILPFFDEVGAPGDGTAQQLAERMLSEGSSIKTIRDTLLITKMILHYGVKMGAWSPVDTTVHFPSGKAVLQRPAVLSKPNLHKLLTHLRDNFSFTNIGIYICLHSGMRIGEVCGLQWKDLDTGTNFIHVNKTVQRIYLNDGDNQNHSLLIGSPKSASSVRDIPMSTELRKLIHPLRKIMKDDNYVVSNKLVPMEPRLLRDYFKRLLRGLDIPQVRFHALRHGFATRCIESKCDYKTVSVLLGHASVKTTMDLYVHPTNDDKRRCIERITRGI